VFSINTSVVVNLFADLPRTLPRDVSENVAKLCVELL
jgi:hypothetical protein